MKNWDNFATTQTRFLENRWKKATAGPGTNDLCSNEIQLNAAANWVENDIHECSWNLTADQILLDVPCKSIQDVSPTYQTALFYVPDEKNCTFLRGLEAPIISDHKHGGAILQRWTARQMQSRLGIFFLQFFCLSRQHILANKLGFCRLITLENNPEWRVKSLVAFNQQQS